MTAPIEEQLNLVKSCFLNAGLGLMAISGSFRVTLKSGKHAYIYSETFENRLSVTVETTESEPGRRAREIQAAREELAGILEIARIGLFRQVWAAQGKWTYAAPLLFEESPPASSTESRPVETPEAAVYGSAGTQAQPSMAELQKLLAKLEFHCVEKQLDWMYISPQSPARLAFRAILKARPDTEQLSIILAEQARRLAGHEAATELELIRKINTDMALQPVIEMISRLVNSVRGLYQADFSWERFFEE